MLADTFVRPYNIRMQHEPTSLDALFRPVALVAVLMAGEALALILALAPAPPVDRAVLFGLASLAIQWIALGTLGLILLLRVPLARMPPARLAWTCLALLLAVTVVLGVAGWSVLHAASGDRRGLWPLVARMLGIALMVWAFAVVLYRNHARATELALRAKQLQLEALRARVRPHFLFNALNTSIALLPGRPHDAERVLLDLADLFRAALGGAESIPLAQEVELTRHYLDIEALRFGPRLQTGWTLPGQLPDVRVPTLSLQPLVENAIRHGIERLPEGGRIDVRILQEDGALSIEVENDAAPPGSAAAGGHRIGLSAARERLRALGDGEVTTRWLPNGRHLARMRIPLG